MHNNKTMGMEEFPMTSDYLQLCNHVTAAAYLKDNSLQASGLVLTECMYPFIYFPHVVYNEIK